MIPCMVPAEAKDRRTHRFWMPGHKKAAAKGKHGKLSFAAAPLMSVLFGSEDPVYGVAQTRTDVGFFI